MLSEEDARRIFFHEDLGRLEAEMDIREGPKRPSKHGASSGVVLAQVRQLKRAVRGK